MEIFAKLYRRKVSRGIGKGCWGKKHINVSIDIGYHQVGEIIDVQLI